MSRVLPTVDLVIPVLNEAHVLEKSVQRVRAFLKERFPYPARIVIADNGSSDGTGDVARSLSERYPDVVYFSIDRRGRGRALRKAWSETDADIVAYTDVDLSTDLEALTTLCRGIHEGGYDLGTGSRLKRGARTTRCFRREIISRLYNLFIKCVLFTRFSDAQCGFKALSRRVVDEVVPLIKNQHWFFDTELLVLAEKLGYRTMDIPVTWLEDPDSRVKVVSTAWEDIKGVFRLRWKLWAWRFTGELARKRRRPDPRPLAVSTPQEACP